ncbi:MAG TPA: hypothetical protein VE078_15445 [Thermoanaerobaculia bacterium]|nr:hypothetical protein [Thermoanaerobaculia bacterium]
MEHLVSETCLARFASGRTSAAENRSLVLHLLHGCGTCSQKLHALTHPDVSPAAYDHLLSRVERSLADIWSSLRHEDLRPVLAEAC